jgi:hypothetical protein
MRNEKISAIDRIQLFKEGRPHYLEFLRNLSGLAILLSTAFLLYLRLDFTKWDWGNALPTVSFFVLLIAFFIGVYANTSLFYERCFSAWGLWLRQNEALHSSRGGSHASFPLFYIRRTLLHRLIELFELVFALILIQSALGGVIVIAISNAIKITHGN